MNAQRGEKYESESLCREKKKSWCTTKAILSEQFRWTILACYQFNTSAIIPETEKLDKYPGKSSQPVRLRDRDVVWEDKRVGGKGWVFGEEDKIQEKEENQTYKWANFKAAQGKVFELKYSARLATKSTDLW